MSLLIHLAEWERCLELMCALLSLGREDQSSRILHSETQTNRTYTSLAKGHWNMVIIWCTKQAVFISLPKDAPPGIVPCPFRQESTEVSLTIPILCLKCELLRSGSIGPFFPYVLLLWHGR